MLTKSDELFMARCIQLARNGEMGAAPNPMVGAVIVNNGRIIGEGYHIKCGGPHAEVNAFRSVKDNSLLSDSTMYVSLEPCAHFGRTPPCARMVAEKGVRRVVVGCIDPFARVSGRGVAIMREAGIEVEVGVLEEECRRLNRKFFTFHLLDRPFITLKWAQTADGVMGIASPTGRLVISSPATMRRVHQLRATHKAILVGYNTALLDNPSLTTRLVDGENPLRIVLDMGGTLPANLKIFDNSAPTMVVGYKENKNIVGIEGVEFFGLDENARCPLASLLAELKRREVQSLLVEGGSKTLKMFLDNDLWDEIHAEHSAEVCTDKGVSVDKQRLVYAPEVSFSPTWREPIGNSVVWHYERQGDIGDKNRVKS